MDDVIKKLPGDLKELAELIGLDHTLAIVNRWGGSYLIVAKCEGIIKEIRDNEIRKDYDTGKFTIRGLVRKYKLTDRTISTILSKVDTEVPLPLLELIKA